jgi:hypothetical protein
MTCLLTLQSSAQSTQEKKEEVSKRTHGEGKPWRSRSQETEDADSVDRREQAIGRDCYCCRFFCVEICPSSKVTRMGYSIQAVTQKLVRQGECIRRTSGHTGKGRNPSNQDETGSVLRLR